MCSYINFSYQMYDVHVQYHACVCVHADVIP